MEHQNNGIGITNLLKRAQLALEHHEWKAAAQFFDEVLNYSPEYAEAYLGKVYAENQTTDLDLLIERKGAALYKLADFQKALRFLDEGRARDIRKKIQTTEEKKQLSAKKRVKRVTVVCSMALVVVLLVVLSVFLIKNMIIPNHKCKQAISQMNAGNFQEAVELFEESGIEENDKYLYQYSYARAMLKLEREDFEDAIELLFFAQEHEAAAKKALPEAYFAYGKALLEQRDHQSAKEQFDKCGADYPEIEHYLTACSLVDAENEFWAGNLSTAKALYEKLPQDYAYDSISVSERLQFLEKNAYKVAACGKWGATRTTVECKQEIRYPKNTMRYDDAFEKTTDYITVRFIPNTALSGGTWKGEVCFSAYKMGYAWPTVTQKTMEYEEESGSSVFYIDLYTKLTMSGSGVSLYYLEYQAPSSNEKIRYETNTTYNELIEAY